MSDVWARLVVVLAAVAVIGIAMAALNRRRRPQIRRIGITGLGSGVYLFSSRSCEECSSARARLADLFGRDGYTEVRWEDRADEFLRLAVESVPSTLVVRADGSGDLHPGVPPRMFEPGNP